MNSKYKIVLLLWEGGAGAATGMVHAQPSRKPTRTELEVIDAEPKPEHEAAVPAAPTNVRSWV